MSQIAFHRPQDHFAFGDGLRPAGSFQPAADPIPACMVDPATSSGKKYPARTRQPSACFAIPYKIISENEL
jgi:hypothetical protein